MARVRYSRAASPDAASPGARSGSPDLRRTLRRSFRTGGEPLNRAWQRATPDGRRRLVLLLDVSGSMADYSRALLMVRARRASLRPALGSVLLRDTTDPADNGPEEDQASPDEGAPRAMDEVVRLGQRDEDRRVAGAAARHGYARGGETRGAVVVVCSDGLEVGDPDLLPEPGWRGWAGWHTRWREQTRSHESPEYEPLGRRNEGGAGRTWTSSSAATTWQAWRRGWGAQLGRASRRPRSLGGASALPG